MINSIKHEYAPEKNVTKFQQLNTSNIRENINFTCFHNIFLRLIQKTQEDSWSGV